tara:strand:+ start:241679 stop:242023 length:345 start_codon:yes stop_codon:yes gene_type:complete
MQATAQNETGNDAIPTAYTQDAANAAVDDVDAGEMLSLAAQSAGDVLGFCDRNPDVCSRGGAIVAHVARQGSYYGGQAFLWLTEKARQSQENGPEPKAMSAAPRPLSKTDLTGA